MDPYRRRLRGGLSGGLRGGLRGGLSIGLKRRLRQGVRRGLSGGLGGSLSGRLRGGLRRGLRGGLRGGLTGSLKRSLKSKTGASNLEKNDRKFPFIIWLEKRLFRLRNLLRQGPGPFGQRFTVNHVGRAGRLRRGFKKGVGRGLIGRLRKALEDA